MSTSAGEVLKDQVAADERTERGAEKIKSLGEIESAGGRSFRPENRDVRVSGDLEHGKPEADNKERDQKKRIRKKGRGRPEKSAAGGGNHQANDNSVFVTKLRNRIGEDGGDREIKERADKVRAEKCELHQHGVEVIERECVLEARDQDVVEDRHESPHEKEDGHDREGPAIGFSRSGGDRGQRSGGGSQKKDRSKK